MDNKLLHEIEEVLNKVDSKRKKNTDFHDSSKKKPYSLNNSFVHIGMFFFLIFLVSITQTGLLFQSLSVLSFIISTLSLLKTVADIFNFKKLEGFNLIVGIGVLLLICFSYFALWNSVLEQYSLIVLILSGVFILILSGFYLLHAYSSYLQNKAKNESLITFIVVLSAWLFLIISFLYRNMLTYLILIIITLILVKAVYDFSQQFVLRGNKNE